MSKSHKTYKKSKTKFPGKPGYRTRKQRSGLDPIDKLTELKSSHEKGIVESGLNVMNGNVENLFKKGVIEPLKINTQAIKSASEAALMILRIDDVISAGKLDRGSPGMPPGMPY